MEALGKFDRYKIDLKGLQADSAEYEFLLDNQFFAYIDGQEFQKGKVNVTLKVRRAAKSYELDFHTEGIVLVPCDRCLDEMELQVTSNDKLFVKFGNGYSEEKNDVVVIPEEEGEINVAWFMYEFIALNIPMKHVHAPGKCNKAVVGKLNKHLKSTPDEQDEEAYETAGEDETIEEDTQETVDPRWNELKKILDNN